MTYFRRWRKIRQTEKIISLERTRFSITACWNRSVFGRFYVSVGHYQAAQGLKEYWLTQVKAFTFPENPPREKILGNFVVPKDTTIIVDAFAINIRNPFWGPDNRAYRPSRFAGIKQSQVRISNCP